MEKKSLLNTPPIPSAGVVTAPPAYQVTFQGEPPQLYVKDPLFVAKMERIQRYEIRQTSAFLRVATANIWPNVRALLMS